MQFFVNEMNLERSEKLHTEIYLNNKNRTWFIDKF